MIPGKGSAMRKPSGLRKRWLKNTVAVLCALALVCALAVTVVFAAYYYNNMESDMRHRAKTTTEFFADYLNQNYNEFYQSCINYAQTFEDRNNIELQFINAGGQIVASSYGQWAGPSPTTPEIAQAVNTRSVRPYLGMDPLTGERIIAVSSPMIYSNGEVIGVLRFVSSTRRVDHQIVLVALIALVAMLVVVLAVVISSNFFVRSIMLPVNEITEKAKRIAGGTYGIQIEKKYNDEIGELADTINELSDQINRNEKLQTEFISSLSHELRTPLTAINGWSETILGDDNLDPNTRRGVRIIQRESDRLTGMVMDLLDFTRIQDGRMNLNMETVDLRSEFEDTVFMYGSRLSQEGIELVYLENDQEIPEISCDPKRMRQVFLNILDNAAKHGGEGKRIETEISCDNGYIRVKIRDFGPGIPADELSLVKKKFYKGSSKARGSGIGLAVCDEIVQMHGGTLTLENAPGGGTVALVDLPVTE